MIRRSVIALNYYCYYYYYYYYYYMTITIYQAFLVISIISTIIILLVTALDISIQYSILKSVDDNDDDEIRLSDSSAIDIFNPMNTRIGIYIYIYIFIILKL